MQSGGMNSMQNQMGQIQQMMRMMNCKNPEELVKMMAKQKGMNDNDIQQLMQMAKNFMSKK
jgi:hypothetical protein